jgi:hypothetical protein
VAELNRQARLGKWVACWYVSPLMGTLIAYGVARGDTAPILVISLVVGAAIISRNWKVARRFEAQALSIDESQTA